MHKIVGGKRVELTEEEVAERFREENEFLALSIIDRRVRAYGCIGHQLGMIFDELKESGTLAKEGKWFKHIEAVKRRIPKGEA